MKTYKINSLLFSTIVAAFSLAGCGGSTVNIDQQIANLPEAQRLRYFKEIHLGTAHQQPGVTGKDVRVTIMGEAVDASHTDLSKHIIKQYNTFAKKDVVLNGSGNQPYGFDKMGKGDGHGTHIAGTIAASCDGKGIQGIACDATLDVYDLGAYDSAEKLQPQGWGNTHEFARFMQAFSLAMKDVTRRGESKITTGSFNMESPYIPYQSGSTLQGLPLTEIINDYASETDPGGIQAIFSEGAVKFINHADQNYLKTVAEQSEEPIPTYLGTLLPLTKEWSELANTLAEYQRSGGVYLITESNNIFNRTSVLNAMPSISPKVDKDLWLSVVMVMPAKVPGGDSPTASISSDTLNGRYITPLNHCGKVAKEYCILTPSYNVLSTMTEKVRESSVTLYNIDGRMHQVFSGHSMGAPMVAATLALMQEYNQKKQLGYSMKDLVRILKDNANRNFPGYDPDKHGRGILDVSAALAAM